MAFAGATRAERDLRDAFRAIKLMRADLEQTRAEKEQLAAAAARWGEQAAAAREAALMREEDFQAQLARIAQVHAAQLVMCSVEARAADCPDVKRRVQSGGERPEAASDDEEQDVTSKLSRDNQLDNNDEVGGRREKEAHGLVAGSNHEEQRVGRLLADETAQEKLRLQAEIQRLGRLLEERTSTLLEERVRVAEAQQELELSREEAERGLVDSHAIAEDLAREKQHVEEKYEFLHTELDVLKQDQREWKEKLRVAEDAKLELEQAVDDMRATHQLKMIAAQNAHQMERAQLVDEVDALKAQLASASSTCDAGLVEQIQQELASMGKQLELRDSEIAKLREELTRVQASLHSAQESHGSSTVEMQAKLESFSQTSMILKGQLVEKEEETARLRVSLREQEEELQRLRADCANLQDSWDNVRKEHDSLQSTLQRQADEAAAENSSLQRAFREQEARMEELRHDNHELEAKMEAVQLIKEQATQELKNARQELHQAEDETSVQRDEFLQLRDRCDKLEQDLLASSYQLESIESERKHAAHAADDMKRQLEQELQDARVASVTVSGQLTETQAQAEAYEQECKNLSMEKKALQQELRQVKLSAKHAKDELANAQSHIGDLEHQLLTRQHQDEVGREHFRAVCHRLEAFERRAMQLEDFRHLDKNDALDALFESNVEAATSTLSPGHTTLTPAAVWSVVKQKIAELDKFLPHLQSFAVFLDDALCACESNATTLSDLCAQFEQAGNGGAARDSSLLQDVVAYVRFACQLQQTVVSRDPEFVKRARRFHRHVFEVMAHWCEVTDHDEIPAPPVAIASREVALILANWARDKAKRVSTRQWLEQVEAIGSASDGLSAELGMDGTTLVLDDMTVEVKQAFLMLIVPILRRNPAVFVRVFTRLVSPSRSSTRTTIVLLEDKRWEMKIHVQPSARPVPSMSSMHPPVLSLDAAGSYAFERSPVSPSSVSSSSTSSSATSFASARLQIIQERLQRMQSR